MGRRLAADSCWGSRRLAGRSPRTAFPFHPLARDRRDISISLCLSGDKPGWSGFPADGGRVAWAHEKAANRRVTAALDPATERRCRESFARQAFVLHLGGEVESLAPGRVSLRLPFRPELSQQHGFFHAGALTTLADTAAGYAAFTLMPEGAAVLTVELKMNLLRPGRGVAAVARAEVLKPGRTLMAVRADVFCARDGGNEELAATMLATTMCVQSRPDVLPG